MTEVVDSSNMPSQYPEASFDDDKCDNTDVTNGDLQSSLSSNNFSDLTLTPSTTKMDLLKSPFKHIQNAILKTLSPPQSDEVKNAMKNASRKRTRLQMKVDEILTSGTSVNRLLEEKIHEKQKIKTVGLMLKILIKMSTQS